MSSTATASNTTAPTQILQVSGHSYAYRRFGNGSGLPLLCLQHFTGTLDNWDPAVSDPLASGQGGHPLRQRGNRAIERRGA